MDQLAESTVVPINNLACYLGREVILDTGGPILYLGTLREIRPDGFWLANADYHDRNEGRATNEKYVFDARVHGIRPNRGKLFVFRQVVISISALDEVVLSCDA